MKNPNEVIGSFMIGIGAFILHPTEEKILLIKRASDVYTNNWEIVYGRINQGEELIDALHREVKEEVGLEVEIVRLLRLWHVYRGEKKVENEIFGTTFVCRAQKDAVTISEEHSEFAWVKPQDALAMIQLSGIKLDFQIFMNDSFAKKIVFTDLEEGMTTV